jgi:hypothetical protein
MSDISLHGLFGGLCVLVTIAAGVLGLVVALVVAAIRASSGGVRFATALRRAIAGPATCTAIGLIALAWVAEAPANETVDQIGPFVLLAGLLAGIAAGVAVARISRRRRAAPGSGPP